MTRLAIVIATYNSTGHIDACLRSLAAAPPLVSHEVIVVDNASPDGTAAHVRAAWPRVRVIDAGGNRGFAAATNIGIRASAGELVLLLNPDTVVPAGAIDTLVQALDATPDTAAVGPRLVDGYGRAELSWGPMIGPFAELTQKLLVVGQARHWRLLSEEVEQRTRMRRTVDWVSGACLLVRRADAEAVGLLDERFFLYTEDVDFCAALRARGRRIRFVPDAQVTHLRGQSRATAGSFADQAYRRSQLAFYRKHHPAWAPVLAFYLKIRGRLPDTQ